MIVPLAVLTGFIFSVLYPLCFWISYPHPPKSNFHKFHIGLPNVVGGVTVVALLFMDISLYSKMVVLAWKAVLVAVSSFFWKKEYPDARWMSIPSLVGFYAFARVQSDMMGEGGSPVQWIPWIIGGCILCAALFTQSFLDKKNGA